MVARPLRRDHEQRLLTALRWTFETLDATVLSAERVWDDVDRPVRDQLGAALALLDLSPVAEARAVAPNAIELAHIAGEGHPWNLMGPVTGALLRHQALTPADLARQIQRDDHWRLFHLAVLGEIVCAAREAGRKVRSTGPVAAGRACYAVDDIRVWIEGGYDHPDHPYRRLSKATRGSSSALTPDIVVLNTTNRCCLAIEVKWYGDGTRALRDATRAALAYALDAHPAALDDVTSVAILPDHQVIDDEKVKTSAGQVGVAGVRHVADLVAALGSAPRRGALRSARRAEAVTGGQTTPATQRIPASSDTASARMRRTGRRDTSAEMLVRREVHRRLALLGGPPASRDAAPPRRPALPRRPRRCVHRRLLLARLSAPRHLPQANARFWHEKLAGNIARDRDTDRHLAEFGWVSVRIWAHVNPTEAADRIEAAVR